MVLHLGISPRVDLVRPCSLLSQANPAMERMLGYTAEELALIPFAEYTHPDDIRDQGGQEMMAWGGQLLCRARAVLPQERCRVDRPRLPPLSSATLTASQRFATLDDDITPGQLAERNWPAKIRLRNISGLCTMRLHRPAEPTPGSCSCWSKDLMEPTNVWSRSRPLRPRRLQTVQRHLAHTAGMRAPDLPGELRRGQARLRARSRPTGWAGTSSPSSCDPETSSGCSNAPARRSSRFVCVPHAARSRSRPKRQRSKARTAVADPAALKMPYGFGRGPMPAIRCATRSRR